MASMSAAFTTTATVVILLVVSDLPLKVRGVGCKDVCVSNGDCTSLACSRCLNYECRRGTSCGGHCAVNTDCDQTGDCTSCSAQGRCVLGCGQQCSVDSDCLAYGNNCKLCSESTCKLWVCGMPCNGPVDCQGTPNGGCSLCDPNGRIEGSTALGSCRSGCGLTCLSASDCPGRCPFCTNSTCQPFSSSATEGELISQP